jgi:PhzF family phenazine biosynthesis protein
MTFRPGPHQLINHCTIPHYWTATSLRQLIVPSILLAKRHLSIHMADALRFATLDVFTDTPFQGNPLAIVTIPPRYDISDAKLQAIAREFNLSETVFLYLHEESGPESGQNATATADQHNRSNVLSWRIRIFMVDRELPFAGHPTVGTAIYALTRLNDNTNATRARLHCPAGITEVDYDAASRTAKISIPQAVHLHTESKHTIAEIREMQPGLTDEAQIKGIEVFSPVAGMNFLNVELSSLEALGAIATTAFKPTLRLDSGWDHGFCATLFYVKTGDDTVRTRMIAGPLEDPATGAASCGLGAMLALQQGSCEQPTTLRITQGVEMGRRSEIGVTTTLTDSGKGVKDIELFGTAVQVMEGTLMG